MKLTKASIAGLALPPGKSDVIFFDDDMPGFGVRLRAGGKAVWIIQYRVGLRQRRETLGDIRKVDLDKARKAAKNRFAAVTLGGDPAADKAEAAVLAKRTFGAVVEQYLAFKADKLQPNSLTETARYLRKSWRELHAIPIHKVTRADVAAELSRIATESGGVSANRAKTNLSTMYTWAMREGLCENNPMIATNRQAVEVARERILTDDELRAVWQATDGPYGALMRFLLLTATRRNEAARMRWDELAGADWIIPAVRMKGKKGHKRDHLVILSPQARAILDERPVIGPYVFTMTGRFPLNNFVKPKAEIDRISGVTAWTIHDLRRTARSLMSRAAVSADIAERCLAHKIGGIRGVYDRYEYRNEKAHAFEALASLVERIINPPADNVTSLDRRRARGVSQVPG